MIYTLLCCHCGSRFNLDFSKGTFPAACPHCHAALDSYEVSKLNDFLDRMDAYNERFHSVKVVQASESVLGKSKDLGIDSTVFSSDIQNLKRLYDDASDDGKALLTSVIDKLYLLLNRDNREKSEALCSTQRVYELLAREFFSSTDDRNKAAAKILNNDL